MKNILYVHISLLILLILIIGLTSTGNIHFGYGLGDLAYVYVGGATILLYILLLSIMGRKLEQSKVFSLITIFFFVVVLIYLIYSFTIGRGPESEWDGTIFF